MGACSGVEVRTFTRGERQAHISTSARRPDAHFVSGRLTVPSRIAPEVLSFFLIWAARVSDGPFFAGSIAWLEAVPIEPLNRQLAGHSSVPLVRC